MSWNYTTHNINRSFEQLASWYRVFMDRTETSFQILHERVKYLEQRQAQQDDEQLERVLRMILAEKFADPTVVPRAEKPTGMRHGTFVLTKEGDAAAPKPIELDIASLGVDPEAVPSKAYGETLQMLENKLRKFPDVDVARTAYRDDNP